MSDAPAASVTENGVPPFTQNTVEAPGFKVLGFLSYPFSLSHFLKGLRRQSRVLYHG